MTNERTLNLKLILAASASGKTHFLSRFARDRLQFRRNQEGVATKYPICEARRAGEGIYLVDGDVIIDNFSAWPTLNLWYKENYSSDIHFSQLAVILSNAVLSYDQYTDHLDVSIVFNGGMEQLDDVIEAYTRSLVDEGFLTFQTCLVEIPEDQHKANIISRHEDHPDAFPTNWTDAHNNRDYLRKLAEGRDWKIYDSFEEASGLTPPTHMQKVIFAGPLHGKTTAHESGITVDMETEDILEQSEDEEIHKAHALWRELEHAWKADRVPEDRERRNDAYTAYSIAVIKSGDFPVLTTHLNRTILEECRKSDNIEMVAIKLDKDEWKRRTEEHMTNDPDKIEGFAFRVLGVAGYYLDMTNLNWLRTFEWIEDAVKY